MPPNPVGIEGVKPIAKGGRQLAVGVAGENEQGLEHGLPRCLGLAARGFEVGPAGSAKDVQLALAVPHFWEDVRSSSIAQV